MTNTEKRPIPIFPLLIVISLINYLIFHASYILYPSVVTDYINHFLGGFIWFILPIVMAVAVFRLNRSPLRSLGFSLAFASTGCIYLLPYFYLKYVLGIFDSLEALFLSNLSSIIFILILAVKVYFYYLIMKLVMYRENKKNKEGSLPLDALDFGNPTVLAILCASAVRFLLYLGKEIYDTVVFFIDYGKTLRTGEIVYMVMTYVYLIISFLFLHFIACKIYARTVLKRPKRTPEEDEDAEEEESVSE